MKSVGRRGAVSAAPRVSVGTKARNTCRLLMVKSGKRSILVKDASLGCRSSCWRPARIFRHIGQGCWPSKALEIAAGSESCFENSPNIRVQATDCSTSQWPPNIAKTAMRQAELPTMWNNFFKLLPPLTLRGLSKPAR